MKKVMFDLFKKLTAVFLVIWNIISIPIDFVIGLIVAMIVLPITLIELFVFGKTKFEGISIAQAIDYTKENHGGKLEAIRRIFTHDHNMTDFKNDFWRAL